MSKLAPGRCDFCFENEASHTVNGGMWWLCTSCMNKHYRYDEKLKVRLPKDGEEE